MKHGIVLSICSFLVLCVSAEEAFAQQNINLEIESLYTSDNDLQLSLSANVLGSIRVRALGKVPLTGGGFGKREFRATIALPHPRLSFVGEYRRPNNANWEYVGGGLRVAILQRNFFSVSSTTYLSTIGLIAKVGGNIELPRKTRLTANIRWHKRGVRFKTSIERPLIDHFTFIVATKWRSWNNQLEVGAGISIALW